MTSVETNGASELHCGHLSDLEFELLGIQQSTSLFAYHADAYIARPHLADLLTRMQRPDT